MYLLNLDMFYILFYFYFFYSFRHYWRKIIWQKKLKIENVFLSVSILRKKNTTFYYSKKNLKKNENNKVNDKKH